MAQLEVSDVSKQELTTLSLFPEDREIAGNPKRMPSGENAWHDCCANCALCGAACRNAINYCWALARRRKTLAGLSDSSPCACRRPMKK